MATNTYTALATQVVTGGTTTNITFTGISQAYTDLHIVFTGTSDADDIFGIQVGNTTLDTGTNYSDTYLYAEWFGTGSSRDSNKTSMQFGRTLGTSASKAGYLAVDLMGYSNTTTYKTALARSIEDRSDGLGLGLTTGVSTWRSTAAINTIKIFETGGSNLRAGFTATIYGIANADIGAYATGGLITYDANYYYHTFAASGTFTPKQSLTADILVVAGGGSGGSAKAGAGYGGGGGAGGLVAYTSQSLTASGYTCTVGAGGAGVLYSTTSGSNSSFGGLTASVGGGGGGYINSGTTRSAPLSGGSGGGGSGYNAGPNTGASGTSGQGNTGGTGTNTYVGGGGGGAGAAPGTTPNGGIGATSALINAMGSATSAGQLYSGNYYFAGGGGGADSGIGGYGGGGNGATPTPSLALTGRANTGGGGGAGTATSSYEIGYSGGSGIIIVRYAR